MRHEKKHGPGCKHDTHLVVQGVVVWEGVLVVGGLVGGQEEAPAEGQGADLVEVREAEGGASEPSWVQACRGASGTEEHLNMKMRVTRRTNTS